MKTLADDFIQSAIAFVAFILQQKSPRQKSNFHQNYVIFCRTKI